MGNEIKLYKSVMTNLTGFMLHYDNNNYRHNSEAHTIDSYEYMA